jgi:hypothetical protein
MKIIRTLFLFALLGAAAAAQTVTFGTPVSGGRVKVTAGSPSGATFLGLPPSNQASLPQNWVAMAGSDPSEIYPPGGTYAVTRTATTFAQMQQAICDWVAAPDQWWLVQVTASTTSPVEIATPGYSCSQGSGPYVNLTLLTKIVSGGLPTKFLVFESATPLTSSQTVCSHGITDAAGTRQPPSGDISTWWASGNNGCSTDISSLATLEGNWTPGNQGLLIQAGPWDATTNLGPSHYAFLYFEFRPKTTMTTVGNVINTDVDALGTNYTLVSQTASHIHFVGIYGHGDAKDWCPTATGTGSCVTSSATGGPGNNSISSFMHMGNCQYCSVSDSYIDYDIRQGQEGHVVSASETPGPLLVSNNWLSGGSSAMFVGGISNQDSNYYAYDLDVWHNRLTQPPSWVGVTYTGPSLVLKNRTELKTMQRALYDTNIVEYSDTSGAQQGQCFTANARQCSNTVPCNNYQVTMTDLTYRYNICRTALTGFSFIGRSDYTIGNGGGAAGAARRFNVYQNLLYNLGNSSVYDSAGQIPYPYGMRVTNSGQAFVCAGTNASGVISLACGSGGAGLLETAIQSGDPILVTGCSDSTWNAPAGTSNDFAYQRGTYALPGTAPTGLTVVYYQPSAVSSTAANCVVQNMQGFPSYFTFAHNTVVMQTTDSGKNNGRMFAGATTTMWSDTGTNCSGPTHALTPTAVARSGNVVTATVSSITGYPTQAGTTEIIIEVSGMTPSDLNGTFYYDGSATNAISWLQTGTNESATGFGTVQQMGTCPANQFIQGANWTNNLLAFDVGTAPSCPTTPSSGWTGWFNQGDGNVEGCASGAAANGCSENLVDTTNSLVAYNPFPGRCSARYMEVGGAHAGAIPPSTLTFPAATVCSGSTATAGCIGMTGMMNGAAFDVNDANINNYGLVSSSSYHNTASDGTDYGVNLTALNAAFAATTQTQH